MSRLNSIAVIALVLLALVAALIPVSPTHAISISSTLSSGCQFMNNPAFDSYYGYRAGLTSLDFNAGETITLTAGMPAESGINDVFVTFYDATAVAVVNMHSNTFPATVSHTFGMDISTGQYGWFAQTGPSTVANATWTVSCGVGSSSAAASSQPGPGPEMGLVTPGSVVGRIVTDAETYYTPGKLTTNPLITLPAGKTVWVVGMDATKTYYKIIWSADYLWIKAGMIGPNPDALWQNWPLPDRIVE